MTAEEDAGEWQEWKTEEREPWIQIARAHEKWREKKEQWKKRKKRRRQRQADEQRAERCDCRHPRKAPRV